MSARSKKLLAILATVVLGLSTAASTTASAQTTTQLGNFPISLGDPGTATLDVVVPGGRPSDPIVEADVALVEASPDVSVVDVAQILPLGGEVALLIVGGSPSREKELLERALADFVRRVPSDAALTIWMPGSTEPVAIALPGAATTVLDSLPEAMESSSEIAPTLAAIAARSGPGRIGPVVVVAIADGTGLVDAPADVEAALGQAPLGPLMIVDAADQAPVTEALRRLALARGGIVRSQANAELLGAFDDLTAQLAGGYRIELGYENPASLAEVGLTLTSSTGMFEARAQLEAFDGPVPSKVPAPVNAAPTEEGNRGRSAGSWFVVGVAAALAVLASVAWYRLGKPSTPVARHQRATNVAPPSFGPGHAKMTLRSLPDLRLDDTAGSLFDPPPEQAARGGEQRSRAADGDGDFDAAIAAVLARADALKTRPPPEVEASGVQASGVQASGVEVSLDQRRPATAGNQPDTRSLRPAPEMTSEITIDDRLVDNADRALRVLRTAELSADPTQIPMGLMMASLGGLIVQQRSAEAGFDDVLLADALGDEADADDSGRIAVATENLFNLFRLGSAPTSEAGDGRKVLAPRREELCAAVDRFCASFEPGVGTAERGLLGDLMRSGFCTVPPVAVVAAVTQAVFETAARTGDGHDDIEGQGGLVSAAMMAVAAGASLQERLLSEVRSISDRYSRILEENGANRQAELIRFMIANPVLSIKPANQALGGSHQAVRKAVNKAVDRGWLESYRTLGRGGRQYWLATEVVDLIRAGIWDVETIDLRDHARPSSAV